MILLVQAQSSVPSTTYAISTVTAPFISPLSHFPQHVTPFTFCRRPTLLHHRHNANSKLIQVSMKENVGLEAKDAELLVETCIVRILPPALTLEQGLQKIKDAVEELKLRTPCSSSGMFRFQVLVPSSAKALQWFCCQPESSEIFPQFFLSKEKDDPTFRSLSLRGVRGVFGIGAAVLFEGSLNNASREWCSFKRFLSVDSKVVKAYGFMDVNFELESSSIMHTRGSCYFLIPEIELDESEGICTLAATLVWDETSLCRFEEAIQSFELTLQQVSHNIWNTADINLNKSISSALTKYPLVEDNITEMVHINAPLVGRSCFTEDVFKLEDTSSSSQFFFRLSQHLAIANNMFQPRYVNETSHSIFDCPNINSLWATIIVEECCRLGLTYFCVAPGSRSTPLTLAASTHPLATCISCFDERSLAFHAVGYAKGSHKPAVVITSSGTAVSNLLPAVVEASQNFVPLLLLTADRPPELQDVGANQAINQVNHFGSFVRFFYGLPAPSDDIPARMALTTLDSAVYRATNSPFGPVHINFPFREPLHNKSKEWMLSCLKGLKYWMSSAKPFTSYINANSFGAFNGMHSEMAEVLEIIQRANKGILLIGAIHREDDIRAALLLAKRLSWPVIADILSGLRLRKYLNYVEIEDNFMFIDHMDNLLLSENVRNWIQADVIIQIGGRITSKRIYQMIEDSYPCTYIFVDNHPFRHDPSHLVTHRVQSTVSEFADTLLKAHVPKINKLWCAHLRALEKMVAWEISFLIHSENSLTEPYVGFMIPERLHSDSAIFLGNSMVIRDVDMYARGWTQCTHHVSTTSNMGMPCLLTQVAGNRGASGIDGLLSTAVGYAVGCNKRVICVVGDVSFLYDTNGLALLKQRISRKPMTILVLNNHGGAIFSFLPVASNTEQRVLDQYFYTAHDISFGNLCLAHGLKHVQVETKLELNNALLTSQKEDVDCVIEVESSIKANANFHGLLRQFACQAADDALSLLSSFPISDHMLDDTCNIKVSQMKCSHYRIQLRAPPTSASVRSDDMTSYREGFVIALTLEDGCTGFGEVAPLEIHEETMADVEEQLQFFIHVLTEAKLNYFVPLLKGSFSSWFLNSLGILPESIFPSVRCGLEMAILNAIAAREGPSLLNILHRETTGEEKLSESLPSVQICALLDSNGIPTDVADIAAELVEEGFSAIKMKVARRSDPIEDAMVIQEVRKKVGPRIKLRVDANRKWTYEEAVRFGNAVMNCDLQYIEEPVRHADDIIKFCEETGLPVALDETIDKLQGNPIETLAKFSHSGVAAVVIKPSVVGGFENAALIARWAQQLGKMSVISATFESSLGLSAYVQFSCYLDLQNANICRLLNKEPPLPVAHGLGTYQWLKEDISSDNLNIQRNLRSGFVEAASADAGRFSRNFNVKNEVILRNFSGDNNVHQYRLEVNSDSSTFSANILEIGQCSHDNVVVFLHGFLGSCDEWTPIMKAFSASARCIAVDLPGHGGSKLQKNNICESAEEPSSSVEVIADMLERLLDRVTPGKVSLVGYSMGARIALYMALRCNKVKGAVIVSGSPGLKDALARKIRKAKDDSKALSLIEHGLELFVDNWYAGDLWNSLRDHPCFKNMLASRLDQSNIHALAKVLSDASVGRQSSLWYDLKNCEVPLLLIVGEKDHKFKRIADEMKQEVETWDKVEIPNCGHAVHLENPLALISAISRFLNNSEKA